MNRFKKIFSWALTLFCLGYVGYFFSHNHEDLKVLRHFSFPMISGILLLHIVHLFCFSLRFRATVEKCSNSAIPVFEVFKLITLSRFLNQMLPQSGNFYRGFHLKKEYKVTYTRYVAACASLAWMDICFNFLLAPIVVTAAGSSLRLGRYSARDLFLFSTAVVAGAPFVAEPIFRMMKLRSKYLAWLHAKLSEVLRITIDNLRDGRYVGKFVFWNTVMFGLVASMLYLAFVGLGIRMSLAEITVFYALYKLSIYVNITPGNLGVRELAYGVLSQQMNIGMAEGILASAIIRILGYFVLIGLGLAFVGLALLHRRGEFAPPAEEFSGQGE